LLPVRRWHRDTREFSRWLLSASGVMEHIT
jgi:hypothetical protein